MGICSTVCFRDAAAAAHHQIVDLPGQVDMRLNSERADSLTLLLELKRVLYGFNQTRLIK